MLKLKKRWTVLFMILAFIACRFSTKKTKEVEAADIPVEEVEPYKKPTGEVKKFLGIWLTSGYSLQPQPYNYTTVDNTIYIYTDQARSFVTALLTLASWARYQWYETSDGKKWTEVPKKQGGRDQRLVLTPGEVGTKYYQQKTTWSSLIPTFLDPTIYSQVAAVHTLENDVDATDIEVTTDDEYIYNYDAGITTTTTYAHAQITPSDFTGQLHWSIDRPELATIDENTGLITANNRRKSGEIEVTATATNADGNKIFGSTKLLVGGGLEDQTVHAGEKATFKLLGNIGEFEDQEDLNYSIRWFKEDPLTNDQSEIEIGKNSVQHTTPVTTLNDDKTTFTAVIQVKSNGKTYEYTTNEATLHVIPDGGPDIDIEDTLKNTEFDDGSNTPTSVFDAISKDNIVYDSIITNNSTGGQLKQATYTIPFRKDTDIQSVSLDGITLDESNYSKTTASSGEILLMINNLHFDISESHHIQVETEVGKVTNREMYRSTAYLTGTDNDGESHQTIGTTRYLNLITNQLEYQIKDIDYGSIKPIGNDKIVYRQNDESNWPYNIMEIDDMRRSKTPVTLKLSQKDNLKDTNDNVLNGRLKFFDDDYEKDLLLETAVVAETQSGQEMNSLSWLPDKGVLLELDQMKLNSSGNYQTKLSWEFVDSI